MKYFASVEGRTYEIAIDHHGQITVDGVAMAADMQPVSGRHLYSLLLDNTSHEVVLDTDEEGRNLYEVMVAGLRYQVKVQDERSRRLALADRSLKAPSGELAIKAPIPGLVVSVLVELNQEVAEGETLIILEAMKMENELRAPRAGAIREVRTESGAQVALGQVLVTLR
ncbi:MAG: acetyl-CoA carboxylase biotin carboxyl carrier protein subunit [Chloroflexi bacterium HGW-Chloroflexi-1]|nr:MAG: acetyl-CoA carboxylase biotin carboxyl carrier protein subunit [Chloroflexi bacterium HGW-Chloroflexi-1]